MASAVRHLLCFALRGAVVMSAVVALTPPPGPLLDDLGLTGGRPTVWLGALPDSASSFAFQTLDEHGHPFRFWPCNPIRWKHNIPDAAALASVRAAVEKAADASGLQFIDEGDTTFTPTRSKSAESTAEIFIATAARKSLQTEGRTAAPLVGLELAVQAKFAGEPIRLGVGILLDERFTGEYLERIAMHELGHALGLDHVNDPTQVMNPEVYHYPAEWGAGDLAGLAKLSAPPKGGCLPTG